MSKNHYFSHQNTINYPQSFPSFCSPGDTIGFELIDYQFLCSELDYVTNLGDVLYAVDGFYTSPTVGDSLTFPDSYPGSNESPYHAIIDPAGQSDRTNSYHGWFIADFLIVIAI